MLKRQEGREGVQLRRLSIVFQQIVSRVMDNIYWKEMNEYYFNKGQKNAGMNT